MRDLPWLKPQFLVGDKHIWGHGVAVSDDDPFFIQPTDCSDSAEDGGGSLTGWIWLSFLIIAYPTWVLIPSRITDSANIYPIAGFIP